MGAHPINKGKVMNRLSIREYFWKYDIEDKIDKISLLMKPCNWLENLVLMQLNITVSKIKFQGHTDLDSDLSSIIY